MKRLYILIPDIKKAILVIKKLVKLGVAKEAVHILVKDQGKLEMTQLLEANIFQTTDVIRALVRGALAGGSLGLIVGWLMVKFPPEELVLGYGTMFAMTLFGLIFGAWSSSLIGISVPHPVIAKFERAIAAGGILLLVDVAVDKASTIVAAINLKNPGIKIYGADFPSSFSNSAERR